MAVIGTNAHTLSDWAKKLDPDGKIAKIAELLEQTNEILADKLYMEGNLPTGHRLTVRTSLPRGTWRQLNRGVSPTKSTTAQITEECAMLEDWSEVDKDLADLNGNTAAYRLSEAMAHLEGMNQEMAETLFYGNSGLDPEQFMGLAPRMNDLGAENGQNIIDGGGTGSDNASVYLVVWGPQTVFGIFPKGSKVGLVHEDLGLQVIENPNGESGTRMMGYRDRWQWKTGLSVKDWRYIVRIANIDISNLVSGTGAAELTKLLIKAIHRIPNLKAGRAAFYMNRSVFEFLDIQRRDDVIAGGGLKYENVDGVAVPMFRGIPVRRCDALTDAEARVV
jgi:hypothetical protein